MPCTEAYKEHIEYTFNAFCRVVIHYAAINAWRDRDKRRLREHMGRVDEKVMHQVDNAIAVSFGLHPETLV